MILFLFLFLITKPTFLCAQDVNPDLPDNTVTTVLQKGYKYGEKLLRPALVRVSST